MTSRDREAILALEKRRNEVLKQIQPALDELAELESALRRLTSASPTRSIRAFERPNTAKELHALLADAPHGLKPSEMARKTGLTLATIYTRLGEMTARGEVRRQGSRYVAKSVVPGAEPGPQTLAPPGPTPNTAPVE